MGIYDRDYLRDEPRSAFSDYSMVTLLILVNVGLYILNVMFGHDGLGGRSGGLEDYLELKGDLLTHPWQAWQLVTSGFVHAYDIRHVLFNMFGLWFFGRDVEGVYGRWEFLRIYLSAIIVSGLAWAIFQVGSPGATLIGASGGVMGIMMLFVLHFPRRLIYIWGVLPVPAWAMGTVYVVFDVLALNSNQPGDNVAHVAHLAGALFGFIYYRTGWNLGRLVPQRWSMQGMKLRPKLRIHDPADDERELSREVDRILAKISSDGEASLSKQERSTLVKASQRYQQRRH